MSYDVAYQQWLAAKKAKDYKTADAIRSQFERNHGLTIFAEGEMPIEGLTVRRMKWSDYEKKYGNPKVGADMETYDSNVRRLFPDFKGTQYLGRGA